MRKKSNWTLLSSVAAATIVAGPIFADPASPADAIKIRVEGLREMGAAFKAVHDALQDSTPQTILLQMSARQIVQSSHDMYGWFPAGSGPETGLKTNAKAEIWSDPADFKKAQDGLAAEALVFQSAIASNDMDQIRAEATKLGQACQSCHQQFRTRTN
jgi:cytochrome c556